jgi:hypothetical protein
MARIRSIKPSFFTNENLAELSYAHRLCFIGLWTLADREGRLEDRPRRIKAALFPYDDLDVDGLLTGLADEGFIVRYTADGAEYIAVLNFSKHQHPKSDEWPSVIPAPILPNPRGIARRSGGAVTVPPLGNRELGNRELGNGRERGTAADGAAALAADGVVAFVDAWNRITALPIPRCRDATTKRKRHIRARLTERPLTEWETVMERIQASAFCRGENDRGWRASIDWLTGAPDVAVKVLEGTYDDRLVAERRIEVDVEDWWDECKRLHAGKCGGRYAHHTRKLLDEAKVQA